MAPLRDFRFLQTGAGPAAERAAALLCLLGADVVVPDATAATTAIAHHGRIATTRDGDDDDRPPEPGVVRVSASTEGAVADGLRAVAAVVELLSELGGHRVAVDGPGLAAERAHLLSLPSAGAATAGGAGRMVPAADGWVAVSLPRPGDLDLLPAWLGQPPGADPWDTVTAAVAGRRSAELVAAAQELGLAAARVVSPTEAATDEQARSRLQSVPTAPFLLDGRPPALQRPREVTGPGPVGTVPRARPRPLAAARVVDLSSLWAGPLATSLLCDAGVEVVKVESIGRPDGARSGPTAFFDLLHAGKRSVALDLPDPVAVAHLQALVDDADLVVEASRPRALDQLGIVRHRRWLTLTAYGATGPWRQWSGFGDDAAVAGGLVSGTADAPAFYGDAVADPLAGLYAAAAALAVLVGEPASVDLALREVANHVVGDAPPGPPLRVGARRHRPGAAPALGEGNQDLLRPADAPAARAR